MHLNGVVLPDRQPRDLWVVDGQVTYEPVAHAETVIRDGWILPGLVDAHCHVGLASGGAVDRATAEAQARADLASGVTLIRDAGSPIDTHWLDDEPGFPRIVRAGRHIAAPRRYLRGFAVEVAPEDLVEEVVRQGRAGDGWVKLVGDWIDREEGDLAPLWPRQIAQAAIEAAHRIGVRVTAHCFGEQSVSELVDAGIDGIEHGCGADESTIEQMARRQVALVPTLDNLKIFPGIADQAESKYPVYAAHMRHLYGRRTEVVRMAVEAGVSVYAGTDAGGTRAHGTILGEIEALAEVGGAELALGAASWRARRWLGFPGLDEGAAADLVAVRFDPRIDPRVLAQPSLIMVGGRICRTDG
ncbi:MAG: amidohydrolase family protein [Propionibacteriaceae bacterium]|nr:amidohydrolase family protein [Propionibacteriaceae bacterium]